MINMVQNAKDQAAALAMAAYQAAVADGTLPQAEVKTAPVEIPKDTANGDFTTTFALAASKALRQPPRNIAQALLDHMDLAGSYFASAEIAGPGFLNFRLNDKLVSAACCRAPWRARVPATAPPTTSRGRRSWWSSSPPTPPAPCTWATPGAACWATRWPVRARGVRR